jgi:hypothetical protein
LKHQAAGSGEYAAPAMFGHLPAVPACDFSRNQLAGATFSRAWKLAAVVLVSHIPAQVQMPVAWRRLHDAKLMSANGGI